MAATNLNRRGFLHGALRVGAGAFGLSLLQQFFLEEAYGVGVEAPRP